MKTDTIFSARIGSNSTTVQQYNSTTVQQYNSTTVQQYNSTIERKRQSKRLVTVLISIIFSTMLYAYPTIIPSCPTSVNYTFDATTSNIISSSYTGQTIYLTNSSGISNPIIMISGSVSLTNCTIIINSYYGTVVPASGNLIRVTINDNNSLSLNGCNVFACNLSNASNTCAWRGFYVNDVNTAWTSTNASIQVINTYISDAQYAIQSLHYSSCDIQNSTFNKNYSSVVIDGQPSGTNLYTGIYNFGCVGSRFSCTNDLTVFPGTYSSTSLLLPPFNANYTTRNGIEIKNVGSSLVSTGYNSYTSTRVMIGSNTDGQNEFDRTGPGIAIRNSNAQITNCKFSDCTYVFGGSQQTEIYIDGLTGNQTNDFVETRIYNCNFLHAGSAVYSTNESNMYIDQCDFSNFNSNSYQQGSTYSYPPNSLIKINNSRGMKIHVNNSQASNFNQAAFDVYNNNSTSLSATTQIEFDNNFKSWTQAGTSSANMVITIAETNTSTVYDLRIIDNVITAKQGAIKLSNINATSISDNLITGNKIYMVPTTTNNARGLLIVGCTKMQISADTITADPLVSTSRGINISASQDIRIHHNNINLFGEGIYANGQCTACNIVCNTITGGYYGIYLDQITDIGILSGGATNKYIGYYDTGTSSINPPNNTFSTSTNDIDGSPGACTPDYYYTGGGSCNNLPSYIFGIVTPIYTGNCNNDCTHWSSLKLNSLSEAIEYYQRNYIALVNGLNNSDYSDEQNYLLGQQLWNDIQNENSTILTDTAMSIYNSYSNWFENNSSILLFQQVDDLLSSANNSTALSVLNSINPINNIEQEEKQVMNFYINSIAIVGYTLSSADSSWLLTIAQKHPLLYGKSVLMSRALIGYYQDDHLPVTGRFSSNNDNQIFVYPNPCAGEVNISGMKTEDVASIELIDLLGKKIFDCPIQNKQNFSEIENGIYLLHFKMNNGVGINLRLLILN